MPRSIARRQYLVNQFGGKCRSCGYNRCLRALQFHHLDSTSKKVFSGNSGRASLAEVQKHPERFEVLCANCHFETHEAMERVNFPLPKCLMCGEDVRTTPIRIRQGRGKYCSKKCEYAHRKIRYRFTAPNRFRKYVIALENGCWGWSGTRASGTPTIQVQRDDGTYAPTTAARVSYFIKHDVWPKGRIQKNCQTPHCLNPDHFWLM